MPLQKINHNDGHPWGLWRIREDEQSLREQLISSEQMPAGLKKDTKRLEWLAGRLLVKALMEHQGIPFAGIVKDNYGKPFPAGHHGFLSLSHSYPYVAAYLHPEQSVGIDLEQPKEKLFRVAPRIFDAGELADAGDDLVKHCLMWCAKEVMVKVHGRKDLIFAENLRIEPFSKHNSGNFLGRIIVGQEETTVRLYYEIHRDFTVVLNKP